MNRLTHCLAALAVAVGCSSSSGGTEPTGPDGGDTDATVIDGGDVDGADFDGGVIDALQPDAATSVVTQMNDVSILFPLPQTAGELEGQTLKMSAAAAHGVLLPNALYDRVGHISGTSGNPPPGGNREAAYADLRVVGLRLDPCFASLAPDAHGAGCRNQLRLVVQEVGVGGAFDSALHLFYSLTRDELLALARQIVALRAASAGDTHLGPLAPHPVMVREGLAGPMAKGVRELVLRYAGAQRLVRVTELSATSAGFAWTFRGFDISAAGDPTPIDVASLTPIVHEQSFFRGFGAQLAGRFTPQPPMAGDLSPLANVQTAMGLSAAAAAPTLEALVRIDDPRASSPETVDCASCHLATPLAALVAAPVFSFSEASAPGAFMPDAALVRPEEMAITFPDLGVDLNVHAFSYFEDAPGINRRTVNETAAVVEYFAHAEP